MNADCIVDVRDLVSGEGVKSRVAPGFHAVDRLGEHHPFFDKQRENMSLKQFPEDGNIKDGDKEVSRGLDRDDCGRQRCFPGGIADISGARLPCSDGQCGKEPSSVAERRAQRVRQRENRVAMGDRPGHLRTSGLDPQNGALARAGWAETSLLARKGDEIFAQAGVSPDACETALWESAAQKAFDDFRDDSAHRTERSFESTLVFPLGDLPKNW